MRWMPVLSLALVAACGTPADADKDDTDMVETDSSVETDDTTDTDVAVEDACASDPCMNGGTCEDVGGEPECTCVGTYEGPTCEASPVFVPPGVDTLMGDNLIEFGLYTRMQIRLNPSTLDNRPFDLSSIRFRRDDEAGQDQPVSLTGVKVWLATEVVTKSAAFDDRMGSDKRLIFDGDVTLGASNAPSLDFEAWTLTVDPPFSVDPAVGALRIEIQMPNPVSPWAKMDCKNNGQVYMWMTSAAFSGTTPPASSNNLSGCGPAMQLGVVLGDVPEDTDVDTGSGGF